MTEFSAIVIGNESLMRHATEELISRGHRIAAVVTRNPDLRDWAQGAGLRVEDQDAPLAADAPAADWLFSVANLSVLKPEMLARGRLGAINFHDGPLPRMAGLNVPLWAMIEGKSDHGITWHLIEGGIDEGDILATRQFPIRPDDNALTMNARCFARGAEAFADVIQMLENGAPIRQKQDLSQRGYYALDKRPEAASLIDFSQNARQIVDLVRALDHSGYWNPLAEPKLQLACGRILPVRAADYAEGSGAPGQLLEHLGDELTVAVADGAVRLVLAHPVVQIASPLPLLAAEEKARLTALSGPAAKADGFWRKRLARMSPAVLPGVTAEDAALTQIDLGEIDATRALPLAAAVLARLAGQVETDIAFQPETLAEAKGILSPWLPLRVDAAPRSTLAALGQGLADQIAQIAKRGPFMLDLLRRAPELREAALPDLAISLSDTPLPTALRVVLSGGRGRIDYDASRISAARAERAAGAIRAGLSLPGEALLKDLPLLSDAERQDLLYARNQTAVAFTPATIHELIAATAASDPDAVAVVFENRKLTRGELDRAANALARQLVELGVGPDKPVGIFARRSPELVIAALAVLKAGGAYVPLDPDYPADRIALYVEDSAASVVLVEAGREGDLPPHGAQVITIPAAVPAVAEAPVTAVQPENIAYLIFTSGSTGRPKGVMVEHRNVTNFFAGMDAFIPHQPGDAWLAVTSLSFDISVLEIFWTLARGMKLVIAGEESRLAVSGGAPRPSGKQIDFSLFYWGNDDGPGPQKYKLLLDGARFADENGFTAVWTPERHFHAFGGPYPNPSVSGAAVAAVTKNIAVRAGSCVLPLHHPARVAEEWSVIDNLTGGRAGLAIASGWQPDDFVLRPENRPPQNKPSMIEGIDQLRRLWRGEAVSFPTGDGKDFAVVTQPRPVQPEIPLWMTVAGNPDTWKEAGRLGMNVLTHLLGQSIEVVEARIKDYHAALREAGHDPAEFKVSLMLHTCLAADRETAREIAREPMKAYLRSAAALVKQYAWDFPAFRRPEGMSNPMAIDLGSLSDDEMDGILEFAFLRYFEDSGLFGSLEDAIARVEHLRGIGVGEIACLIDYGIAPAQVVEGFPLLAELRRAVNPVEDDSDFSIAAQIRRYGVTHLQCTPSMARILVSDPVVATELARLKCIMVGGEALPPTLLAELRKASGAKILNMYGPTETTIWSTVADLSQGAEVTLGRPIANTQVYVLDGEGNPVPPDGQGELWIGGHGVTRGYWQRPDLTEAAFRPDPFVTPGHAAPGGARMYKTGDLVRWREDGLLDYLGRADHQIKLRGFRIELGEIESALAALPGVRDAVAIVREDSPGDRRLVGYVTGASVDEAKMRETLIAHLPGHMVPGRIVTLDQMPLTPNRKIDRKQLPPPGGVVTRVAPVVAPAPVAPPVVVTAAPIAQPEPAAAQKAELLDAVARIWRETLGVPQILPRDNFFAMGGHSLLAIQLHRTLRDQLGLARLGVTDIFRFPVFEAFQKHVSGLAPSTPIAAKPVAPAPAPIAAAPAPAAPAQPTPQILSAPAAAPISDTMARRRALRAQLRQNG
ncbi:MupA/Atu3671 family FMN-dependent luciferase-like monooxygenase [Paracoccus aminophilus]|uniref:Dimodular nonribosomal peptide synthetase n=1 Tax=Paracoccus aminophilus JCM 7686 TaxID=1367847 RepID=S5XXZ5_PARAH|nr:MupA/Atu3671 family FMN-dependent luciferase-like monooxygenase [Paracoccus aminophilus]AGT10172.1 dimodular nonribosomal peptide synthetase [Paracoccus aminophilus JCM 7686]